MGVGDGPPVVAPGGLAAAVFLDRDGVITEPVPDPRLGRWESPYRVEDVALAPDAAAALRALRAAGFLLIGVSNQPAAAKGTVSLERPAGRARAHGGAARGRRRPARRLALLPPPPGRDGRRARRSLRLPKARRRGFSLDAAREHGIDLAGSWMIGDSDSDVLAGQAAGTRTVLIEHPRTAHRRTAARPTRRPLRAADLEPQGLDSIDCSRAARAR